MKTLIYLIGGFVVCVLLVVGYTITMGLAKEYFPLIWDVELTGAKYTIVSWSLIIGTGLQLVAAVYNASK